MNYELQDLWNLWNHDILKWERKLFSVLSKPLDAKVKKKKSTTKYYDSVETFRIQYWILMNFSGKEKNEQHGTKETIIHKFSLFCTMQESIF